MRISQKILGKLLSVLIVVILGLTFGVWVRGAGTSNVPFSSPRERGQHAMVFDCANQKTILFGGSWDTMTAGFQQLGDTWAYDYRNNLWTELAPSTQPSARDSHAMVYDSTTNQTILFGGGPRDTWVYDYLRNTWIQKFTGTAPPSLYHNSMVYDPVNQKTILFGGMNEGIAGDDFWAYDSATNTWTELNPPLKPEARYGHTMVYDSANQQVILFGGNSAVGYKADTWAYDYINTTWVELNPATFPSPRYWHTMTYDTANQKGVLFGGFGESGDEHTLLGETWTYDYSSNQWEALSPSVNPAQRANTAFAYDSVNQKAIMFGGHQDYGGPSRELGDTWVYTYSNNSWVAMIVSSTSTNTISQSTTDLVGSSSRTVTTQPSSSSSGFFIGMLVICIVFLTLLKKKQQ